MKKKLAGILSAVAAWLLLLSMLLTGVFICTTSRAYYRHEYQKYGQAQNIGIDDDGLMRITNALLDYLWGSRDSLDMQAEINGQLREVFTQREKDHMVDVRAGQPGPNRDGCLLRGGRRAVDCGGPDR